MRSPRTAPPVKGLLGSTAITPTVCCRSRITLTSASASVLLPVPGAPVNPTRYAFPVWGWTSATSWLACGSRSSARLMARASARTSPESKAPAKLISIRLSLTARFSTPERAHHRALFHTGARSSPRAFPHRSALITARFSTPERAHHRALFHAGARSSGGGGEGFEGEVGTEEDRDARAARGRRDRRHDPAEVVMEPGHGGGRATVRAIQNLSLGDPLRGGGPDAGLPPLGLEQ